MLKKRFCHMSTWFLVLGQNFTHFLQLELFLQTFSQLVLKCFWDDC
jgi:hypothetical protein